LYVRLQETFRLSIIGYYSIFLASGESLVLITLREEAGVWCNNSKAQWRVCTSGRYSDLAGITRARTLKPEEYGIKLSSYPFTKKRNNVTAINSVNSETYTS
jgi:hypothetical protein